MAKQFEDNLYMVLGGKLWKEIKQEKKRKKKGAY